MFIKLMAATCVSSVSAFKCHCVARILHLLSRLFAKHLYCVIAVPTRAVLPNCAYFSLPTDFMFKFEKTCADFLGFPLPQVHVSN